MRLRNYIRPKRLKMGQRQRAYAFRILSKLTGASIQQLIDERLGILQYKTSEESGEGFFISHILPYLLRGVEVPIFFDLGLNEGEFTSRLLANFSEACVFGFEPNPEVAERARARYSADRRVSILEYAVSEFGGGVELFDYGDSEGTSHASLYLEVMSLQHGAKSIKSYNVECITIDEFCQKHGLKKIDFIKIDTEGHELSVLRGAVNLISQGSIGCIQFEFNEMNVVSRCFLRDFYNILDGYSFYRLRHDGLISLGGYDTRNEIFKFQNIVAIRSDIKPLVRDFIIGNPWK